MFLALILAFAKPPSLHAVTASSITIDWETATPEEGRVTLFGPGLDGGTASAAPARHPAIAVSGLRPNTEYQYQVQGGALTSRGSFWTAPAPGSTAPFTFAVVGDS